MNPKETIIHSGRKYIRDDVVLKMIEDAKKSAFRICNELLAMEAKSKKGLE